MTTEQLLARGYRADKVLHELADLAAAVAEARRVLAPGGRAAATAPEGPQ
ncbi:methyltransferase domain-containing protein [Amycolatopsis sp. NPDC051061]